MEMSKNVEYQFICHRKIARSPDISLFLFYDILHRLQWGVGNIDGLVQNCSNSIAKAFRYLVNPILGIKAPGPMLTYFHLYLISS